MAGASGAPTPKQGQETIEQRAGRVNATLEEKKRKHRKRRGRGRGAQGRALTGFSFSLFVPQRMISGTDDPQRTRTSQTAVLREHVDEGPLLYRSHIVTLPFMSYCNGTVHVVQAQTRNAPYTTVAVWQYRQQQQKKTTTSIVLFLSCHCSYERKEAGQTTPRMMAMVVVVVLVAAVVMVINGCARKSAR